MSSEQALIMTHNQGDYGASEGAEEMSTSGSLSGRYGPSYLPTGGLSKLSCIFLFACSRYVVLIGLDLPTRPSFVPKERLNMFSRSNMGDCRFQIIERVNCSRKE
jgi:hypothetical protein